MASFKPSEPMPIWRVNLSLPQERERKREGESGSESPQLSVDRTADWPHLQCQFPLICRATTAAAAAAAVHLPLHLCRKYVKILFAFFCFPFLVHFSPLSLTFTLALCQFRQLCLLAPAAVRLIEIEILSPTNLEQLSLIVHTVN